MKLEFLICKMEREQIDVYLVARRGMKEIT